MFFGMWIFLFFYRMSALGNPPYCDSILGMFQEGIWLYENDFNYLKLAREELGYLAGGPRTYFFSWLPGFYAVLMHVFPTVKSTFVFLHVLNFFFAAALAPGPAQAPPQPLPKSGPGCGGGGCMHVLGVGGCGVLGRGRKSKSH